MRALCKLLIFMFWLTAFIVTTIFLGAVIVAPDPAAIPPAPNEPSPYVAPPVLVGPGDSSKDANFSADVRTNTDIQMSNEDMAEVAHRVCDDFQREVPYPQITARIGPNKGD